MKDKTTIHNIDDLKYIEDLENQVQELKLLLEDGWIWCDPLEYEVNRGLNNGITK